MMEFIIMWYFDLCFIDEETVYGVQLYDFF